MIEVRNISKSYAQDKEKVTALTGINFTVNNGEIGKINSLNVSVSAGIFFYEWMKQNNQKK